MRRSPCALALLLAASPALADYSLTGSLATGGSRTDAWGGPLHQDFSDWNWEVDAALAGTPFRPGLLQFLAGARYRSLDSYYPEGTSRSGDLGFHLQLSAFGDSPLPVSLSAARETRDFLTDSSTRQTGSTLAQSYAGTAVLGVQGYPSLRVAAFRTDLENHSLGGDLVTSSSTALSVGVAHSAPGQTYSASYDSSWNSGTYAETNYRSHYVNLAATASVSGDLQFRVSERYYLRLPTVDAALNPRFDDNALTAGFQWRPGSATSANLDYSYRRALVETTGAAQMDQLTQGVQQATQQRLGEDWTGIGSAGVTYTRERLGGASISGTGEEVGGALEWRHGFGSAFNLNIAGGGSIGATEPSTGGTLASYGGHGSAGVSLRGQSLQGDADYSATYQKNAGGLPGWSLLQTVSATLAAALGDAVLHGNARFAGGRREDPLLGSYLSRTMSATLGATYRRYDLQLSAGISDGLSEALANPISDGLFLPVGYNTHTRFATVTLSARASNELVVTALARALSSSAPGREDSWEYGAAGVASYSLGAFTVSLEDRYSLGGSGAFSQRGNLVLARISRSFGARF